MNYFLALQSTYSRVDIGLFDNNHCIEQFFVDKKDASKQLLLSIEQLLKKNALTLSDLSFLAVNAGPGPFTTLRTVIATINGLSFATHIPLVAVNGLNAFIQEHTKENTRIIALLNAFGKDVYFGIQGNDEVEIGVAKIDTFIHKLKKESFNFIGNGALMHRDLIIDALGAHAGLLEPIPEFPSITAIAHMGLQHWNDKKNIVKQIKPIYLKAAL